MAKIVEGLWDCPYCKTKRIGGLKKHCPECGHPQDKDTKFYMGKKKHYLSDAEVRKVGTTPDWICVYCSSLNNTKSVYCKNCSARREKESKDYFAQHSNLKNSEAKEMNDVDISDEEIAKEKSVKNKDVQDTYVSHDEDNFLHSRIFIGVGVIILAFIGLILITMPRYTNAIVSNKNWTREVDIEEYQTVTEFGWSIPTGGRLLYSRTEIRSYDTVLSHYETRTRTVTEQVFDGYDTSVYYSDNGNGTFTEHATQTPRYRTETRLETYQEPVYKQVPVYDTKYYYEIERWQYERTETSSGNNEEPYWSEYELTENERVSNESETYSVTFIDDEDKEYVYSCSCDEWREYEIGEEVELKLSAGVVLEVDEEK